MRSICSVVSFSTGLIMPEAELATALRAVSLAKNYHRWLFRKIEPHLGRVILDIGSGLGDLPEFLGDSDPDRKLILSDASEFMVAHLRSRYGAGSPVRVIRLDVSRADRSRVFPEGLVPDTVTCLNVLEHLEDDVQVLRNMRSLVGDGGKIVLFVPALGWLYGSLDRMAGHYRRYTREGPRRKLGIAGLKILKMESFNFFGIITWFLGGKVLRRTQLNNGVCAELDKLVPWVSFLEKLIVPPLGQSLIAIASK